MVSLSLNPHTNRPSCQIHFWISQWVKPCAQYAYFVRKLYEDTLLCLKQAEVQRWTGDSLVCFTDFNHKQVDNNFQKSKPHPLTLMSLTVWRKNKHWGKVQVELNISHQSDKNIPHVPHHKLKRGCFSTEGRKNLSYSFKIMVLCLNSSFIINEVFFSRVPPTGSGWSSLSI